MPIEQTSINCRNCQALRLHTKNVPNHLVHALVSLFLCGFWIPVWILIAIASNEPFRCSMCGVVNRHIPPPPVRTESKPTDWHKNLKVIGLIAGIVGGLIIISVFIASGTKQNQKTSIERPAQTLVNFPVIFDKTEKELDQMFGKPVSVTKGTEKGETIRNYAPGKQLLIRMKNGKSISATMYLNDKYKNYRNVLQSANVDTPRTADEKSKVKDDLISAHNWNSISIDGKLYLLSVFSSDLTDNYDAISMQIRNTK